MCIRLTANEEQAPAPQPLQLYQITMSNTGHGQANNVRVTLPYSPEIHSLLDASFSDEQTWVYSVLTNAVEIRTNSLASGDVVTATLRFQINQLPAVSGIFSTRAFASWSNERPGASKVSNLVSIELGRSTRPALSLKISAVSEGKTEYLSIASNNFASYERVSLWYHRPDKNALALGETQSDEHGNILYNAEIDTQEPGQYMVVAYGQCSRVYINGILEVG